jgi:hypothetical protein
MTRKDWPFDVLPTSQRSALQEAEIAFLERAHGMGFHPAMDGFNFVARSDGLGRTGWILRRSARGKMWEVVIDQPDGKKASVFVDDLSIAAEALLAWLSGQDADSAIELCNGHLVVSRRSAHVAKATRAAFTIKK